MNTLKLLWLTSVLLVATLAVGCKSNQPKSEAGNQPAPPNSGKGIPDWVNLGSAAYPGDRGKAFYGVGAMSGIRNPALLRRSTDNQARIEVARVMKTTVSSLAKQYARSVGNMETSQEEQLVQEASKSYTEATLSGVEIVDHFYHAETKTMYALAVLNLETFKKLGEQAKMLPEKVKEYILDNAEDAFKELDAAKKGR